MPGLNLNGNLGVTAALPPSYAADASGASLSSRAYGVGSLGAAAGPKTAAYGSVGIAIGTTLVLLFIWHSLPR